MPENVATQKCCIHGNNDSSDNGGGEKRFFDVHESGVQKVLGFNFRIFYSA